LVEEISKMPLDPKQVPDDELEKDANGNVKKYPKRSKLIEDKTVLMNQAMDGFMKMASGAQAIGLVLTQRTGGVSEAAEDLSKLSKLNVLLLSIQKGAEEKPLKHVEELKPATQNE
jgi:hypothetical protein